MKDSRKHSGSEYDEKKWIELIRTGDIISFEKMVVTYYEPLCNFAYRIVLRSDISEDLVQDLFVKIWENRQDWKPSSSIKAYLFKAIKNNALNFLDHQEVKRRQECSIIEEKNYDNIQSESRAEYLFESKEFRVALQKAVMDLPTRTRQVYTLHRQDGFKYSEIAYIMDISQKTVESQMTRALKSLRDKLEHYHNPVAVGIFLNMIF